MEAIKSYLIEFWQSEMVQDALHSLLAFLLSFVDMGVVHDEVFLIIFAVLIFIGFFFLLAVFAKGAVRAISIGFAFLMMIGAMTLYALVGTGLLQVQFDEDKLAARAEIARKKAEGNRPPEIPPAVQQVPLDSNTSEISSGQQAKSLGLPETENIHWEIYDPYEKPVSLNADKSQQVAPPAKEGSNPQAAQLASSKPEESQEKQAMRAQLAKQLDIIETELTFHTTYIKDHLQELDNQVKSGQLDQQTALAQKARWSIEEQSMILDAMDEKVALLLGADLLTEADKANDLRTINARRQQASERISTLQNYLNQLEAGK